MPYTLSHIDMMIIVNGLEKTIIKYTRICDWIWENMHSSHIQFSTFVTHKIFLEWQIDVKRLGIVEPLLFYHPWKFQIYIPFLVVFCGSPNEQNRICELGTFPKSSHILLYSYVVPISYSVCAIQIMIVT